MLDPGFLCDKREEVSPFFPFLQYIRCLDPRREGYALREQLGLLEKRKSAFTKLSGGQKQRLFIALALINDPEVVFMEEAERLCYRVAIADQAKEDGLPSWIVNTLEAEGFKFRDLRPEQPTLEDVFLTITGKEIRQ